MSWAEVNHIERSTSKIGKQIFTQDGTFTVPKGVYAIYVTMYDGGGGGGGGGYTDYGKRGGAGGAGGLGGINGGAKNGGYGGHGSTPGRSSSDGAGGGAGGYIINANIDVVPGEILNITV